MREFTVFFGGIFLLVFEYMFHGHRGGGTCHVEHMRHVEQREIVEHMDHVEHMEIVEHCL